MAALTRVLKEPIVQFLGIGALLFAAYAAFTPKPEPPRPTITVTADIAERLAARYRAVFRREPTVTILNALIDRYIREEALVREALSLGLDDGDSVIRERLAQKMAALNSAGIEALAPTDDELDVFRKASPERYRIAGTVSFEHVFLGEAPTEDAVDEARVALEAGAPRDTVGTAFLLPPGASGVTRGELDGTFGVGTFDALAALPPNAWGSIASAYGTHLARVSERQAPRDPPLDEVREQVMRDWRAAKAAERAQAQLARFLAAVDVRRPTATELESVLQ